MRRHEAYPSKYLTGAEIAGHRIPVTISHIETERLDSDVRQVAYFHGKQKGLVLNVTNWDTIAEIRGEDPKTADDRNWAGTQIVLYTVKTKNPAGQTVDGIRVDRPMQPQQQTTPQEPDPALQQQQMEPQPYDAANAQFPADNPGFDGDNVPF